MCDFANMGGGNNPYAQRFQQFEQNHPQFQKAWGALQGATSPMWDRMNGLFPQQSRPQTPVAPTQPAAAAAPVYQGGATSA